MKLLKMGFLFSIVILMNSCASKYEIISPNNLNYNSNDINNKILLEYKYDLLDKKYAKKETKKGVKLIAIKITNNSEKDIIFGQDIKLAYENGNELYIMESENVFKSLKQNTATYLLFLLLTPVNIYTYDTNSYGMQETTSTIPVGLVVGPGLAGGNMIAASSANKKFKTELLNHNMNGLIIKKGETKSGLIGIKSDNYDAIRIKIK